MDAIDPALKINTNTPLVLCLACSLPSLLLITILAGSCSMGLKPWYTHGTGGIMWCTLCVWRIFCEHQYVVPQPGGAREHNIKQCLLIVGRLERLVNGASMHMITHCRGPGPFYAQILSRTKRGILLCWRGAIFSHACRNLRLSTQLWYGCAWYECYNMPLLPAMPNQLRAVP